MNRLTKIVNGTAVLDATAFPDRAQETLGREMNAFPPFCEVVKRLAEYEDLEGKGKLIKLPCKPGDIVYQCDCNRIYKSEINKIIYDTNSICFDERAIGRSVFLTKEEAAATLKGASNDQN